MSNWRFTDETETVVVRTNDDGSIESHLATVISPEELAAVPQYQKEETK